MRVSGIAGSAIGPAARRAATGSSEPDTTQSRALIAIEAPAPAERSFVHSRHPAAPFLAQLIATQMQAPQTRARRRAAPQEAISVYAAMAARRG
jgi:hypothetical protein